MSKHTELLPNVIGIPQEFLTTILGAIQPEKIICFGIRSKVLDAWSCFLPDKEKKTFTCYDLLILTMPNEQRPRHELLDIMDNLNTEHIKVSALIHNVITINEAVANGSLFFTRIFKEGMLLYNNHGVSLNQLIHKDTPKKTASGIDELWAKCFDLAQNFLMAASHSFTQGCNKLSAFMLHQAIEHTCIALSRAITGYRPNTHNLGRLITITENFAPFFPPVFPRNTKEEIHLFHVLSRAYSDARYKEIYKVTRNEISILIDRVSAFQNHAQTLYHERITTKARFPQPSKINV